ncbi:MAG: hypothetical protein AAGC49_07155, partial [Brevundimonas sp.]
MSPDQQRPATPPSFVPGAKPTRPPAAEGEPVIVGQQQPDATRVLPATPRGTASRPAAPRPATPRPAAQAAGSQPAAPQPA